MSLVRYAGIDYNAVTPKKNQTDTQLIKSTILVGFYQFLSFLEIAIVMTHVGSSAFHMDSLQLSWRIQHGDSDTKKELEHQHIGQNP